MNTYFAQLNDDLKQQGIGKPQLIIDLLRLDQNIRYAKQQLETAPHLQARLVVKSLACLSLLKKLSQDFNTKRFMVFHIQHLHTMLEHFDQSDMLFGKPMPIQAVKIFYEQYVIKPHHQIHWLIDQIERLKQYIALAKQLKLSISVNLEIDVGLHRGGIRNFAELDEMLKLIQQNSDVVRLTGLMGYDAHVTKIPNLIKKAEHAYAESQQIYARFIQHIRENYTDLWHSSLCFNGGGSPSFSFHVKQSVCNDLSFGSMLLKPSDFDSEYLKALQPALMIATPVLKVVKSVEIPSMSWLNKIKLLNRQKAVFIYGGYWMGQYVYPPKAHPHALYGRSSNQELVCVDQSDPIDIDDYIFFRPSQSESVIPQFAETSIYCSEAKPLDQKNKQTFQHWNNFRE